MSSSKRPNRKKRPILERVTKPAMYPPGGATQYVPPGVRQSTYGQTFYGSTAGVPVGQTSLFSPGLPLPTQPGVNPDNLPIAFRFPTAYNSYAVDRTLNDREAPAFDLLRRLACMDYGIGLCERYWLDMVPKMTLKVQLKSEYTQAGAEEKQYKKELKFFKDFFSKPDGTSNFHEWIQQALIEQSQIDELYLYKHRNRGGKLLGLQVVDGSQMKPLLDDWGRLPTDDEGYAYQQYPWGIPGALYRASQIVHKRETPSIYTPYGRSRVERVLLITNTALRKQKLDLAHFTEGNIPAGILTPPEGSQWTPDLIDAYEQSWNALLAGNLQQLARIKVTQPGFVYTPFVQPSFDAVIDLYWLKIRASVYGVPPDEIGFTESSNRSTGQTQQDVVYRRTIGPLAAIYAEIMTECMNTDFPADMHGDIFEVVFGGYEEVEDESKKATALATYTDAGILGLSNAAKIAKLPQDPNAVHIGRVQFTANGPIFLDDVASDNMRKAQIDAKQAGYEMAANPPEPGQEDEESEEENDEQGPPQNTKTQGGDNPNPGRGNGKASTERAQPAHIRTGEAGNNSAEIRAEFKRWYSCAIKDVKAGKPVRRFVSDIIPENQQEWLRWSLSLCRTPETVRAVFPVFQDSQVLEREAAPFPIAADSGGSQEQTKSISNRKW